MTRGMYSPFPRRKPRMAAPCKHPLCPPPRPVPTRNPKKLQRKRHYHRERHLAVYPASSTDAMKGGAGRKSRWLSSPPSPSSTSAYSRSSLSDTSLPLSSSPPTPSRGTILPTSVVVRKSSTAWLHLGSAKSSWAFHRDLRPPVSSHTFHSTFCCFLHLWHPFKRCSLVCLGCGHHQHWAVGLDLVQCRYSPVRACPCIPLAFFCSDVDRSHASNE